MKLDDLRDILSNFTDDMFWIPFYNDEDLVGVSYYGSLKIPGLVRKENVMGAQFHPEKSGEAGLNILRNFKELI